MKAASQAFLALVPAKGAGGKSRLSPVLSASERAALGVRMLARTLTALRAVPQVGEIRLVSPDPTLRPLAQAHGARFRPEAAPGLNRALQVELDRGLGEGRAVLIVFADLPQIAPGALIALLEAAARAEVVLSPDRARRGTNALLLRRGPWRLRYGPNSFAKHLAQARALSRRVCVLEHPALAYDLDTPADWARLAGYPGLKGAPWRA